jgi:type I restriction enzyme R subunit
MSEAEIRAECMHPAVKATGWGAVDGSRILREYHITLRRIEVHGKRAKADVAD